MKLSGIRVGTQIEIHIKRGGYNYRIYRKVEYSDFRKIAVLPIVKKEDFDFLPTDEVDVLLMKDSKSYEWKKVKAFLYTTRMGIKLHAFESNEDVSSVNRRKTYRVTIRQKINIKYEIAERNAEGEVKGPASMLGIERAFADWKKHQNTRDALGFLADISEGGASVSAPCELKIGDFISFDIPFGKSLVSCRGAVVRIKPTPQNTVYKMNYGIAFTETSANFANYVFQQQRLRIVENNKD